MLDPIAWLWSFADHDDPIFDELSLRVMVRDGFDRLRSLNFVVRTRDAEWVSCPSCIDGHTEEVVALDYPDGKTRYYVRCLQYRRVEVAPELLERWAIHWDSLARAVAQSLALSGTCTPLVEGRLWRLGRSKWQGVSRDVLLARGLASAEGDRLASQIVRTTRPIVFVGDHARRENEAAIRRLRDCLAKNAWPTGYEDQRFFDYL